MLKYSDVVLVPQYSEVDSRSNCNTSVMFGDRTFKMPVMPSNMDCSISFDLADWLSENDYFYVLHRFYDYEEIKKWVKKERKTTSISMGVKSKDRDFIKWLNHEPNIKVDYITIDVAHGHSKLVKDMITFIKSEFDKERKPFIISGNVATEYAVMDLISWGSNAIKISIGTGSPCTTKDKTGFYSPTFSCVREANRARNISNTIGDQKYVSIIADGGIRCNGDIAKAIVAGADMVMIGGLFAACEDSPAENIYDKPEFEMIKAGGSYIPGRKYFQEERTIIKKRYYGSASSLCKEIQKNIEGTVIELPCNGKTYEGLLKEMQEDLQSACSYAGVKFVGDMREKEIWKIIRK